MQQRKDNSGVDAGGRPVPSELLVRSRVLQILWAHRGRRDGLSLTDLCALAGRPPGMVAAQIAIARRALRREAPQWRIVDEQRDQRASLTEPIFWLVSKRCPRPAARSAVREWEPEIVTFSDLADDFNEGHAGPMFKTLFKMAREH